MDAPTEDSSRYVQPAVLQVNKRLPASFLFSPLEAKLPGVSDPARQSRTRRRLAALFCIPLALSLLFFGVTMVREYTDTQLLGIQNLSASLQQLRMVVTDLETDERSFLLTSEERFLAQFETARASLPSQIETCRMYAREASPDLQARIAGISSALQARTAQAAATVDAAKSQSRNEKLEQVRAGDGERAMQQVRQSIDNLQLGLSRQQSSFVDRQRDLNHLAFLSFLLSTAVLVLVLYRLYHSSVSYLQDRDLASERLRQLNLNLEAQVEERTRDLRLANEELQQFAYVASHDLQEPLRTITSFSQLIESRYKNKLDADADEFIGYIVSSARRMTDLINGLLSLIRLRKAGQPVNRVSFAAILADAEASLQALARETNTEITSGPLPELVVDRVQFAQVLQNLLSNAIKYRREEAPRIHVSARRDESHWVFSVADNGRGFDPQFAERIFGLFQRLHSREAIEGTGMGLSIAKKIIERHGGRMWADSVEGSGSTFYFSLPVSLEGARQE